MKIAKVLLTSILLAISIFFTGCANARPPRPGQHFIWVPKHRAVDGRVIPGHWKYTGPEVSSGKHWVPGHFNKRGMWVPGHWAH